MLEFYENIAKRIEKYAGFLFVLAVAIFIARLALFDDMDFNSSLASSVAMCWPFGLSLISWNYGQETLVKEYGEIERVGKMQKESTCFILYSNLFFSGWFLFISILTIYAVYPYVVCS